jgi:hypothetical protein
MKWFITATILFSCLTIANEAEVKHEEHKSENKSDKKMDKKSASAEAYLKAKKACLLENKDLKGKDLKDCIVKKQSEAK